MAIPSVKSEAMERAFTEITGVDRRQVIRDNVCGLCGGPAEKFRDKVSRKEYTISGLCQECQDETFGAGSQFTRGEE